MPTITVWKNDLYRLAGLASGSPLSELDERLALVKGELSSRTQDGKPLRTVQRDWIPADEDLELRIELADTNRPDLWCVEGIARQLRDHARGQGQDYALYTRQPAERHIAVDPRLETIRPFIGGFLAQDLTLDEATLLAFIEAQETLARNFGRRRQAVSIGLYNGEGLAFPLRYRAVGRDEAAFEPLPPAGDDSWLAGTTVTPEEILQRHPTGREYAWILEGSQLVPLLENASGDVLSFPPIINSFGLGRVAPGARALFVEATGTEHDQVLLVLNILAANLADRGWAILPVTVNYPYNTPRGVQVTAPHKMAICQQVELEAFNRLLGERLDLDDILARLAAYGVAAEAGDDRVAATIPSYRQDYLHAVDVIEDYAISRGYAMFKIAMPEDFTVGKFHPMTVLEDRLRDLMIGFRFEEAVCNVLSNPESLRHKMEVEEAPADGRPPFHGGPGVRIQNVMNRNYSQLRDWLIPSLLEVEAHSAGALYPHRVFEAGEAAVFDLGENVGSRTESRLAGIITEDSASFDSTQSVLYALFGNLGVSFQVTAWEHPSFVPGRVAFVLAESGAPLGFLGELSPQVLTNWGVRMPVAAFELCIDTLLREME